MVGRSISLLQSPIALIRRRLQRGPLSSPLFFPSSANFYLRNFVSGLGRVGDSTALRCQMRKQRRKQEAGEEQAVNRADAGGLEDGAEAEGFWNGADALLLRPGGKKVLNEGNDAFDGSRQNPCRSDPDNAENRHFAIWFLVCMLLFVVIS